MSSSGRRGPTPHDIMSQANEAKDRDMINEPGVRDAVSWLSGNMNPELSKIKGRCFYYPIDEQTRSSQRLQEMEVNRIVNEFQTWFKLDENPWAKYPHATRRMVGRTWPGEARRRLRKTLERKETRRQAAMICKFMVFKGGKFMPGKMV